MSSPELRSVRYQDLRRDPELHGVIGITPEHLRSLADHPYAKPEETAFLLLFKDGRRVARFGLVPGRLRIGARVLPISWDSGFESDRDPDHRGYAGLLFLRALRETDTLFGFGPSELVRPLLASAGFSFASVDRYVAVVRSSSVLAMAGPLGKITVPLVDAALRAERALRSSRAATVGLRLVERFDDRVSRFESERGSCAFYRDEVELNWALSRPWLAADYRYLPFLVHDHRDIVGFALARIRRRHDRTVGTILRTGLAADRHDLAPGLIMALIGALARAADIVELYTNQEHLALAARRAGMRRRAGSELSARLSGSVERELRDADCDLARMPLEFGEGDVIFA